jgi:hypothetical protein
MRAIRIFILVLSLFQASWIAFDGARALATGDYLKPRVGSYGGRLGPWTRVAWAAGVAPRSPLAKACVLGYGLLWLGAAMAFAGNAGWAWWPMILAAVGAFWYSSLAVPIGLAQVLLLLVARREM